MTTPDPAPAAPPVPTPTETTRVVAEFVGTALLLAVVVGSGIATSVDGPASTQLFQHAVAVGVALVALVLVLGPVSGAHLNPAVTAAAWWYDRMPTRRAARYVAAQLGGAVTGVVLADLTFGRSVAVLADTARDGLGLVVSEAVATGGLVLVVVALVRTGRTTAVPGAVGAWVGAAVFSTASACFANPAVTVARTLTDSWTGIAPASVPGFLLGQLVGLVAALALAVHLYGGRAVVSAPPTTDAATPTDAPAATDEAATTDALTRTPTPGGDR